MNAPLALDRPAFLVSYRAQALVADGRVDRVIGPEGQVGFEWDASPFLASWPEAAQAPFLRLARRFVASGISNHAHLSDGERQGRFDGVLTDPGLPAWVRDDTGPFTLLVTAHAVPPEEVTTEREQAIHAARKDQLAERPAGASTRSRARV